MRGYGPYNTDDVRKRCPDTLLSNPKDDADRLADLSAELREAQIRLTLAADEVTRATQRVLGLQHKVNALREAILG